MIVRASVSFSACLSCRCVFFFILALFALHVNFRTNLKCFGYDVIGDVRSPFFTLFFVFGFLVCLQASFSLCVFCLREAFTLLLSSLLLPCHPPCVRVCVLGEPVLCVQARCFVEKASSLSPAICAGECRQLLCFPPLSARFASTDIDTHTGTSSNRCS